jgi:cell division transport system permease protein
MKTDSMGYLTKEGFRNVVVNKLMSIASVSVLFSCLVMIGSAFLLLVNINSIISGIEDQNIITVFYASGVEGSAGDALDAQIKALDNVKSTEFIPNETAYQEVIANAEPGLAEYLSGGEQDFPDAYKVTIKDMGDYSTTLAQLQKLDGVDQVRGSVSLADKLHSIRGTVSGISIGIIGMLLLVSLFIISNTIRITMYSRRLEISIMRSVGATSWFIRWPFMLEGMILGLIAGLLATVAVWGTYEAGIRALADLLMDLGGRSSLPFSHYALLILGSFIGIGLLTGGIGSLISIAKYLKEKEFVDNEN